MSENGGSRALQRVASRVAAVEVPGLAPWAQILLVTGMGLAGFRRLIRRRP